MDATEAHALKFLKSQNFCKIQYEPNGNVPPDFLIDDEIAVEVRRLNQNYFIDESAEGLESVSKRLEQFFNKVCVESGPPIYNSYIIRWTFRRPLTLDKKLKNAIKEHLLSLDERTISKRYRVSFSTSNFALSIVPASKPLATKYQVGGYCDFDAGGWVGAEYKRNIEHICEEKYLKIRSYRERYRRWWLVLPDFFWPNIDPDDYRTVSSDLCERFQFERIVIVALNDPTNFYDLGKAYVTGSSAA